MINYIILSILGLGIIASIVTVFAEMICERNSKAGKFFRYFRIRLREISPVNFCVTSVLLIFWGLIFNDDGMGILAAILMLFIMLFILHAEDVIDLTKRRKKAKKAVPLELSAMTPVIEKLTAVAKELPELSPLKTPDDENNEKEEK
ncbi:MAG: hypothetical protein K6G20_12010 [Ruminococcus sp.]|nr:hypothetical protein [Ruminococcus sp.]MCR5731064.1 hypothetical protein [Ruminococcus sp.]